MIVQKLQLDRRKLQERLTAAGVTAGELCAALGISKETLRNWSYYNGKHPVPWRKAQKMAQALDTAPEHLGTVVRGPSAGVPEGEPRPEVVARLRARVAGGAQ